MSRSFGGTRACNRSPFTWRHRHRTTFSRDQASVEITLKQRVPPPPHLPTRNPMLDQPLSLPAMCEPLILEHHLADLRRRKPCTDRQQPLPPLNASRLTHNQTGKEGWLTFCVCSAGLADVGRRRTARRPAGEHAAAQECPLQRAVAVHATAAESGG